MTIPRGRSFPVGATVVDGGVNFCVFSRHATAIELLLFDGACDAEAARVIRLEAPRHRTYHYWHAFVPGLRAGQVYAYRAVGPFDSVVVDPDAYDWDTNRRAPGRGRGYTVQARSLVVLFAVGTDETLGAS